MIIFIQIAKWFWALFPALIGIMGPTGAYNKQNNLDLQASQLVANSDLTLDNDSNNIPDNFALASVTANSFVGGVFTFTPTVYLGRVQQFLNYDIGDTIYYFANIKADTNMVKLSNNYDSIASHTGNNEFEFLSAIRIMTQEVKIISIRSDATDNFTPISVDYIGAINITAVFGDDIPSKEVLDDFILSDERFLFTDDTRAVDWFNNGFTGESRDILDILGYFFWLVIPIIAIYWVFRLLIELIT